MPVDELNYWVAYYQVNNERDKKELEKQKREAKQSNRSSKMRYGR